MKPNYNRLSDDELADIICRRDKESEKAFIEVYNRYSKLIHNYCRKILVDGNQTEDIFQETFIKFYNKIQKINSTNLKGFLMKIARNLCLNANRDYKTTTQIDDIDLKYSYNPDYDQKEMVELLKMAVDLLPSEFKESFILREYSGLEYDEIADQLDISIGSVRTRVYRAKQKIREILKPYLKDYYGSIK